MVKWGVPFVPSSTSSDPERDSLEWVRNIHNDFEYEQNKMYETLIKDGFLTEDERTADYSGEVRWRSNVTESNMNGQNALNIPMEISRTCFGKAQSSIRMVDLVDGKGYNCVIIRASRNAYEKHIGIGWYAFAREKKLQCGDVLEFSMNPFAGVMFVELFRRS